MSQVQYSRIHTRQLTSSHNSSSKGSNTLWPLRLPCGGRAASSAAARLRVAQRPARPRVGERRRTVPSHPRPPSCLLRSSQHRLHGLRERRTSPSPRPLPWPAPPGLRPPGPAHYACVAPPPGQSLRRRESHWARPRLRARPTLAPAVPRLRPDPLTLHLCPLTQVFSGMNLSLQSLDRPSQNGPLDSNVLLDHDQTCQLLLQTTRSDLKQA